MAKAATKTPKKSPVQMSLQAPEKKTAKPSLPAGRKAPAKAKTAAKSAAPKTQFTKVAIPKTTKTSAKKTTKTKKADVSKIDAVENEIRELEKEVADVNYSFTSMILVIIVVAIMALIGYAYSMRSTPVSDVETMALNSAPVQTTPSVQSENLAPEVIDAILDRVSALAGVESSDELVSANRVVSAPAGQTYQAGDYIFVFTGKLIVYRAEVNQIVGMASFVNEVPAPVQ